MLLTREEVDPVPPVDWSQQRGGKFFYPVRNYQSGFKDDQEPTSLWSSALEPGQSRQTAGRAALLKPRGMAGTYPGCGESNERSRPNPAI